MTDPLVSIIIPLYNRVSLVEETLESIRAQTYPHWEAIVVDDGSTDGSFELAQSYSQKEQRVRVYKRERLPKGAPTCRNIGAAQAKGDYLIFLDSDDLLAPFCLQQRVDYFKLDEDADMVIFLMLLFEKHPYDQNILWNIATKEGDLCRHLKMENLWQTSGAMYQKKYFLSTGGFREDLPFWQDYELHTRMLIGQPKYHKAFDLPPDCFLRRHHQDSISQKGLKNRRQLLVKQRIYDDLVTLLLQDGQKASLYRLDLVSSFFVQTELLIEEQVGFERSKESWIRSRRFINSYNYWIGFLSLCCKHQEIRKKSHIFRFLFKSLRYLMHAKIRKRDPKMCRVKYDL